MADSVPVVVGKGARTVRPPFLEQDGKTVTAEWRALYTFEARAADGKVAHSYCPSAKGLDFHECTAPYCIIEGSRGTGKSLIIRNDVHMRCLAYAGYTCLVVRRTMPELKRSHLKFVGAEMRALGGHFHKTDAIAYYPNGSTCFYSHCETEDDMLKLLSSQYDAIYFDEISTFTWVMITKIMSCLRVEEGSEKLAIVRGGTNPIGVGAADVNRYFRLKDIMPDEDPDYNPDEWVSIHTTLDDNPFIDRAQYIKTLSRLPEHIRRAWLDGEWVIEGAYFHDFKPSKTLRDGDIIPIEYNWIVNGPRPTRVIPWHVRGTIPVVKNKLGDELPAHRHAWMQIYRAVDWGFSPDPAVCLWIAVLPNGRAFVFKEKSWRSTTAREVAQDIVAESKDMRIAETFCDPSMFGGREATEYVSVGDIFEENGVPLSQSVNDRAAIGFAIHEYLNTVLADGLPMIQIYEDMCPMLVRTIPEMRVDKSKPERIANGNDHWVITLGYFCLGRTGISREFSINPKPFWMKHKPEPGRRQPVLGNESVRRR